VEIAASAGRPLANPARAPPAAAVSPLVAVVVRTPGLLPLLAVEVLHGLDEVVSERVVAIRLIPIEPRDSCKSCNQDCNLATDTCTSYDTKKGNVLSAAKGPDPPRLPPPRRHARGLQARSRPGCRSCGSRCCRCCWVGVPPGELGATKAGICAG
jgi:hypothetical protein